MLPAPWHIYDPIVIFIADVSKGASDIESEGGNDADLKYAEE